MLSRIDSRDIIDEIRRRLGLEESLLMSWRLWFPHVWKVTLSCKPLAFGFQLISFKVSGFGSQWSTVGCPKVFECKTWSSICQIRLEWFDDDLKDHVSGRFLEGMRNTPLNVTNRLRKSTGGFSVLISTCWVTVFFESGCETTGSWTLHNTSPHMHTRTLAIFPQELSKKTEVWIDGDSLFSSESLGI